MASSPASALPLKSSGHERPESLHTRCCRPEGQPDTKTSAVTCASWSHRPRSGSTCHSWDKSCAHSYEWSGRSPNGLRCVQCSSVAFPSDTPRKGVTGIVGCSAMAWGRKITELFLRAPPMPHPYSAPRWRELVLPATNLLKRTGTFGLGATASAESPSPTDQSVGGGNGGQRLSSGLSCA